MIVAKDRRHQKPGSAIDAGRQPGANLSAFRPVEFTALVLDQHIHGSVVDLIGNEKTRTSYVFHAHGHLVAISKIIVTSVRQEDFWLMHFRTDLAYLPFTRGWFTQRLSLLADGLVHRADRLVHLREANAPDNLVHLIGNPMVPVFVRALLGRKS